MNVRNNVRKTAHNMGVTGSEYGWAVKWAQDQAGKMGTIRTRSWRIDIHTPQTGPTLAESCSAIYLRAELRHWIFSRNVTLFTCGLFSNAVRLWQEEDRTGKCSYVYGSVRGL